MGKVTIVQRVNNNLPWWSEKRTSRQVVFLKSTPSYTDIRDNHRTLLRHAEQYLDHYPWSIVTADAARSKGGLALQIWVQKNGLVLARINELQ